MTPSPHTQNTLTFLPTCSCLKFKGQDLGLVHKMKNEFQGQQFIFKNSLKVHTLLFTFHIYWPEFSQALCKEDWIYSFQLGRGNHKKLSTMRSDLLQFCQNYTNENSLVNAKGSRGRGMGRKWVWLQQVHERSLER